MDVRFIASFTVVSNHPTADRRLFRDAIGLPLRSAVTAEEDSQYVFSEEIPGAKHFGVWPLAEAAQACFGLDQWPQDHPVPQASVEFEVDDVEAAASELVAKGYRLLHPTRTEPWHQIIARLQTPDGMIVGVCFTPWLHDT
ncbi:VOC family protein [Pengzhenrongella sicca]|uniref:Glyoxalase n=1 Tax=Pengzhenrongella sicca TaxID=2819238 RepID=A0A8A4ZA31_9MICO|nr:VOC family protein [Pengzhenrongella sicca]QTE28772.1 glyoxalase [Pengzhenrongella sicca]